MPTRTKSDCRRHRAPPAAARAARAAIAFVKLRMDWNMSSQLCTGIVSYTDLATHGRVWYLKPYLNKGNLYVRIRTVHTFTYLSKLLLTEKIRS